MILVCSLYRNGSASAVELTLVEAAPPNIVQGIVCSLKESFGFIERADKVSEVRKHMFGHSNLFATMLV